MFFSKAALLLFASAEVPFAFSVADADKIMPAHDDARFLALTNGTGSCEGLGACVNVGENGGNAVIGNYSCVGDSACRVAGYNNGNADIGNDSCNGTQACNLAGDFYGNAVIDNGSCIGTRVCIGAGYQGTTTISDGACVGENACSFAGYKGNTTIGTGSCVGDDACNYVDAAFGVDSGKTTIGMNSCIGNSACYNLINVVIGSGSCNNETVPGVCQCLEDGDVIANDSCNSFGLDQCCISSTVRSPATPVV